MKVLLIDNYDSYTYNLYQLIAEVSGEKPIVIKNDELSWKELQTLSFDAVVISPGPGSPVKESDFGICRQVIEEIEKPIFGVCLGHQGIFHIFGGTVDRAPEPMHGRLSKIYHENRGVFENLPQAFSVVRYHSLIAKGEIPACLQVDARTEDGIIMGLSHKEKAIWAVQFHPESISTEYGKEMIENFLRLAKQEMEKHTNFCYESFPSQKEGLEIFQLLDRQGEKVLWLDSSKVEKGLSRFSIFAMSSPAGYELQYFTETKLLHIMFSDGREERREENIFSFLQAQAKKWKPLPELPFEFQLGFVGYFGYELKGELLSKNRHHSPLPDALFRYCDRAVILDHETSEIYILSLAEDATWRKEIRSLLEETFSSASSSTPKIEAYPSISWLQTKEGYLQDIARCQEWIAAGESYEICLTNRLDIKDSLDAKRYYEILRRQSPGPYSAFLPFNNFAIASSSMEKFLSLDREGRVETKPIKGTIRRGENPEEDVLLATKLAEDEKTKAENLMIVDLLRNDLGKVCDIATVKVPKLMAVESYATLHQLVTTVEGQLASNYDAVDLVKACFPGGSMTGAPKKRTLELIDSLEKAARGVYSGSIGYISNTGAMDLSIVIRTAVIEKEKTSLGVGGAIIALSDPEEEFEEIRLKAKGALRALQIYYKGNTEEEIQIEEGKSYEN